MFYAMRKLSRLMRPVITVDTLVGRCNDRLCFMFDDEKETVTTHLMRKLYGQMAYARWGNGEDEFTFVSDVLAHSLKSLDVALTYLCVRII